MALDLEYLRPGAPISEPLGSMRESATRIARDAGTHIDAGLGQINVGYHAHRFVHPCDLLDPYRNLAIAATILREHHTPGEEWLLAIGRYHRPAGGAPAARYRHSVHRHPERVHGSPVLVGASRNPPP